MALVAVGAGLLLSASCGSGGDAAGDGPAAAATSSAAMMATAGAMAGAPAGGAEVAAGADAGGTGAAAATGLPALDNRQVIRTADLQIRLAVPADTADEELGAAQQEALDQAVNNARAQLLAVGGFVADLRQAGNSASLVVRVPADAYDSFRAGAGRLGEVTSSTESATDVTEEFTDVESRIASMRISIDRIRALLAEATAVGDIITIESELSRREADLESLAGRRQVLADQIALGTVSMTLTAERSVAEPPGADPDEDRGGFLGGLAAGWNGLVSFLGGVGVVVGVVLPFVPLLAVAVLLVWWVRRSVRRARTEPVAAPPVDGPTPA